MTMISISNFIITFNNEHTTLKLITATKTPQKIIPNTCHAKSSVIIIISFYHFHQYCVK